MSTCKLNESLLVVPYFLASLRTGTRNFLGIPTFTCSTVISSRSHVCLLVARSLALWCQGKFSPCQTHPEIERVGRTIAHGIISSLHPPSPYRARATHFTHYLPGLWPGLADDGILATPSHVRHRTNFPPGMLSSMLRQSTIV